MLEGARLQGAVLMLRCRSTAVYIDFMFGFLSRDDKKKVNGQTETYSQILVYQSLYNGMPDAWWVVWRWRVHIKILWSAYCRV